MLSSPRRAARRGFTLLELLVVIAILAVIAGTVVATYSGLEEDAAEGSSAYTLSGVDQALRAFTTIERSAPNGFDSLVAATYPGDSTTPVTAAGAAKAVSVPSRMLSKTLPVHSLTAEQATALRNAGITHLRYLDPAANDLASPAPGSGGSVTLSIPDADGGASATVGALLDIDMPNRLFETPRPGSGRNRGRGYLGALGTGSPVLVWDANRSGGTGGYDNTKLGAGPNDVLVVFGLGNDATCVGGDKRAGFPSAPVFGQVGPRHEYGRFIVAYNLGPAAATRSKAVLQGVMNTHGEFLDEALSNYTGSYN